MKSKILVPRLRAIAVFFAGVVACGAPPVVDEGEAPAPARALTVGATYRIVSVRSGLALDVAGVSQSDGATVWQWNYVRGSNQRWRLADGGGGTFQVVSVNSNKCLDVQGAVTGVAPLVQNGCSGASNQRWNLRAVAGGLYELVNGKSGLCADVRGYSLSRAGNVDQYGCHGGDNQRWRVDPVDGAGNPVLNLTWSFAGPIAGKVCTAITEPGDPNSWSDNYLCSDRDLGLRWSDNGPIGGMICTGWNEGADPHYWGDNYLCSPVDLGLRWSNAGPIAGMSCIKTNEPSDPYTWDDNFLCSGSLAQRPLRVVLMGGQSNMVGNGDNNLLPADLKQPQNAIRIRVGGTVDYAWGALRPGLGAAPSVFGSEVTFGHDFAARMYDEDTALVKAAWSGTSLAVDWRPPSAGGARGVLYDTFLAFTKGAMIQLGNRPLWLTGIVWMQGESDAMNSGQAAAYRSNLTAFIGDVRAAFRAPALPFVIAKIDEQPSSMPWSSTVRQAQSDVAGSTSMVGIFDTKGYPTDGLHYPAAGIMRLGSDFAVSLGGLIGR